MKRNMESQDPNNFKLQKLYPENSFQVPEGYFEAFPERLKLRMQSGKKSIPKKTVYFSAIRHRLAIAASFTGLILLAYSGIKFVLNRQESQAGIQQTGIASLTDYSLYNLDETMIYDLYSSNSTSESSANTTLKNSTDDMIDYLLLEDTDIEILIQDL
jgi:hypothetical protein